MKGRDILKDLTEANLTKPSANTKRPAASGSVKSLKSELDKLADDAAAAKELKASIEREGRILELEPDLIDGASIGDRIPLEKDEKFEQLRRSIEESGQQLPILVRPHPRDVGRFEAAYGHRRLRAAKELGVKVRTIVRGLNDREMIIAQGQENGPRLDLSFIERALYASRLRASNHDRELICEALSVDKPEVSRLLKVADEVDEQIILAIGPARKIGRPRWVEFAGYLKNVSIKLAIEEFLNSKKFGDIIDSDEKFEQVFRLSKSQLSSSKESKSIPKRDVIRQGNRKYGWSQQNRKGATIALEDKGLSDYLLAQLPDLIVRYEQGLSVKMSKNKV